ncbi:MAG: chemotaxis protein CheV [Clostridiales bacterium]|nr:chemotaxis protein CheV [Clostridiales bacterium]
MIETDILHEAGTNEFEVLEFTISGSRFGIDVGAVTELMQAQPAQPMPNAHPCVEGVFKPREEVYTIVDLAKYLGLGGSAQLDKDIYIITGFKGMNVAFHVHAVENIHRLSRQAVEKPDALLYGEEEGVVTGIAKVGEHILSMLDLGKITDDISPPAGGRPSGGGRHGAAARTAAPILVAGHAAPLRERLVESLREAGYTHLVMTTNGAEAWQYLLDARERHPDELGRAVRCVVADLEMPQLDGHQLSRRIKGDALLKGLPVVLVSKQLDEAARTRGEEAGADAQLSAPQLAGLPGLVDRLLAGAGSPDRRTVD